MPISTGSDVLNRILDGGFPENRSVLVSGGPGVGKSTLAMQFLQQGLEEGDECLYVSTEQTTDELHSSFGEFDFDLDHPNLTLVHLHARTGRTIEDGEQNLTMQTSSDDEVLGEGYSAPFEVQYLEEYLSRFAPCDRVVFDSTASLAGLKGDSHFFQRVILDLVRLFTDEFGATSVFTAEADVTDDTADSASTPKTVLEFSTHGVVRLRRRQIEGKSRRFLQVVKMRGIDHDTREYEVGIGDDGVFLTPQNRTSNFGVDEEGVMSTGFDGLDEISGGVTTGSGVLFEHDGRAFVDGLVVGMAASALDSGMGIWLVPSPSLTPTRFESMLPHESDIDSLLDADSLFVLDSFNVWNAYGDHRNVYTASSSGLLSRLMSKSKTMSMNFVKRVLKDITRHRERPVLALVYTEAFLRWFEAPQVRELYYWARENVSFDDDTVTYIHNPDTMDTNLAEFFVYDAQHMFRTWKHDNGIQYVQAEKSLSETTTRMGVVDYVDTAPYVRIVQSTK